MSETKNSVHKQISDLNESFGQITNQTNISNCANQDADLSEDGINSDCKCGCETGTCNEEKIKNMAQKEINSLDQSFGEITPETDEHPYANQDAEFDEDGLDSDALLKTREEEEGEPVTGKSAQEQIANLNESFGQISSHTNVSSCANQDADLSEDGINSDCKRGCGCSSK